MAYTQTQIDALKTRIASGAITIKHGDELIQLRTLDELERILATMEGEASPTTAPRRRTVAAFNRGFY